MNGNGQNLLEFIAVEKTEARIIISTALKLSFIFYIDHTQSIIYHTPNLLGDGITQPSRVFASSEK
jgi:hypothetical protein